LTPLTVRLYGSSHWKASTPVASALVPGMRTFCTRIGLPSGFVPKLWNCVMAPFSAVLRPL
jgi:hypothetical protein